MSAEPVALLAQQIIREVSRAIVGKEDVIRRSVLTLLCNGHLLIEDIPGVGKTTLAKALAMAIGGEFRRIQFTPDLLPSDVTGSVIYDQRASEFEFRPGPIFGNVVLVDEINRATPKTQSALLEAMEERQVSTDGVTRPLPNPFLVIATQNTIEMTGTYPLPEAQLDRFFGRLAIGYPDAEAEANILLSQQRETALDHVSRVSDPDAIVAAQDQVRQVYVGDRVRRYIVDVVRATREHANLALGASPRGSLHLMHAAQAEAALAGETAVTPRHVKGVAALVLAHRVIARGDARARGLTHEQLIAQAIEGVPVPEPEAVA